MAKRNRLISIAAAIFGTGLLFGPVLARLVKTPLESPLTRLELLAYMWDRPLELFYIIFSVSAISFATGSYFFTHQICCQTKRLVPLALSAFLIAVGITFPHVILSPPFQAPDEPSHVLGHVAFLSNGAALRESALDLAKKGHFNAIHGNSNREFNYTDTLSLDKVTWPTKKIGPTVMSSRSLITHKIWMSISELSPSKDVSILLLKFRTIHGLLFAGAIVLILIFSILAEFSICTAAIVFTVPLIIPSMPFFAMHMSNYGLLTTAYALSIGAIIGLTNITKIASPIKTILIGISAGIVLLVPELFASSGISIAPFVLSHLIIACGMLFFQNWPRCVVSKKLILLVISFALGATVFTNLCSMELETNLAPVRSAMSKSKSFIGFAFLGVTLLAGTLALIWQKWLRFLPSIVASIRKVRAFLGNAPSIGPHLVLFLGVILLLVSRIIDSPQLTNIESVHSLSGRRYIWDVCRLFFLNWASSGTDLYLSATFWSGFGWLEKMYPPTAMSLVKSLPLSLLVIGAIVQSRHQQNNGAKRSLWLYVLGTMIAVCPALTILAKGYYSTSVNVHGRYLIGIFLSLVIMFGLYLGDGLRNSKALKFAPLIFYILMVISKSYSYFFLVKRYIS